jgi:hypothetical protein
MTYAPFDIKRKSTIVFVSSCVFIILLGCLFRVWQIHRNQFVFYDEGFYLNHNRALGEAIKAHFPLNTQDLRQAFLAYLKICLASGKSLWFMVADVRVFFGAVDQWFVVRAIAAACGILTIFLTYFFAVRHFQCKWTGWVAAALLALLPSHVFYSRTGLQEAFSTLLVLLGFYFYVFPAKFSWRTFLSGVFFGAAFFSNYRLIMLPVLIGTAELWQSLSENRFFNLRKYVWCIVVFFGMVFGIGGTVFGGINTYLIFAWVFHQQHIAKPVFHWINFLTYPYNFVRLENGLFAAMLFFLTPCTIKEGRRFLLPFVLVIVQIAVFSMTMEKGARYICVTFPFAVMSVAYGMVWFFKKMPSVRKRFLIVCMYVMMFALLGFKAYRIAEIRADYQSSAEFLTQRDQKVKFISTQKYVHDLYVRDVKQVAEIPRSFEGLVGLYSQGYRYLIIDPQAYVSYTEDEKRFSLRLSVPYEYILKHVEPIKSYTHFGKAMLERHVMEHSTNLLYSTEFLRLAESRGYGKLYIYDLDLVVPVMINALARYQKRVGEHSE